MSSFAKHHKNDDKKILSLSNPDSKEEIRVLFKHAHCLSFDCECFAQHQHDCVDICHTQREENHTMGADVYSVLDCM